LPLATKTIKIVDKGSTQKALQGVIDIVESNSLFQCFVFINRDIGLRDSRKQGRRYASQLRSFACYCKEPVYLVRQKASTFIGTVCEEKCAPTRHAQSGDRRW